MDIVIRPAKPEEVRAICNLVSQMSPDCQQDYRGAIDKFIVHIKDNPDYFLWVAIVDDVVIGTAMMHLQHKLSYVCGTAAHLEDVVVDAAWRGKGIGEKLVATAVQTAKEHNCYKIMLTCRSKTVGYYTRFGFADHDIGMRMSLKEEYA